MARLKGFSELTSIRDAEVSFQSKIRMKALDRVKVELVDALGRILAEDFIAPYNLPSFDRSTVDGYAVKASETARASEDKPIALKVAKEEPIQAGSALPVWTGSPIPRGSDAVMMLEYTQESSPGVIEILRPVNPGENIASAGEDVMIGSVALKKGRRLRPEDIGLLAALGASDVNVVRKPRIALISTGSELLEPGSKRSRNMVIDVNRLILGSLVRMLGAEPVDYGIVRDEVNDIVRVVKKAKEESDVVIITGGSSAGMTDVVPEAVSKSGSPGIIVHGVAMRPGRPVGLAVLDGKPTLLLPGNPVAAMFCFEVFARPLILKMLGYSNERRKVTAVLSRRVAGVLGVTVFLRVKLRVKDGELTADPIHTSGAGVLTTMTQADGYVIIPENRQTLEAGESVTVNLLNALDD